MTAEITIFDIFTVFGAGVIVSFTPCVYPVIPLAAASIAGVNVAGGKLRAFFLSLVYVLGLACVYCAFAVAAALTGRMFGKLQNSPVVVGLAAGLLFIFGLVMLDVIRWPGLRLKGPSGAIRPHNAWTALLAGAASGLVVGPCTAPVLGSVLLYIGSKQNILLGVFLMFVFSYGVGASLIIAGTFSGILGSFPKSGVWLVWVKRACGFVLLLASAVFFYKFFNLVQ